MTERGDSRWGNWAHFLGTILVAVALLFESRGWAQLTLRADVKPPELPGFRPLPRPDETFQKQVAALVKQAKLDELTPANKSEDKQDEWSSICVVDITDLSHPVVGGWKMDNFVYPASTYKMYVVGEAIRQVCSGLRTLDDQLTVSAHNIRPDTLLKEGQQVSLAEVLRLTCQHSDNVAANVAIDTVDRQRASALLRAMGCRGSDITRKFLPRTREDEGYTTVPGTVSCSQHYATFLWAVENGVIGGGRGRGLIKAFLSTNVCNGTRFRAGLPASATIFSKTGEYSNWTAEVGIVEDGQVRYIMCVMTAMPIETAAPRIADFARQVHTMIRERHGLR